MALTLELPPEIEARFLAEARAKGVSLDHLLSEYLIRHAPAPRPAELSAEEWERALDEWADSFPASPPLPDEALCREFIYGPENR